jgi:galactose-1-phosphate uridylyltransferase
MTSDSYFLKLLIKPTQNNFMLDYFKKTKEINLKKLEKIIKSSVIDPSGQLKIYEIKIRSNPAFASKSRIAPERESRKIETTSLVSQQASKECFFCDPLRKGAKFSKNTGLQQQYYLNDCAAFSNLFTFGKVHGVIVYNYKKHITDPRGLTLNNWIDGIKLVKEIGKESRRKYVSLNVNSGPKAAASLEHFHGQFHCEDEPLSKTLLCMNLTKKLAKKSSMWWKSWIKSMLEKGLVIDFDENSKTVLYVEWSPVFGKTELVVINLENPCFQNMDDDEIETVAKFLEKAIKIIMSNISDQFNIVNLSASPKDDFCNQFRIFPRAPLASGTKSWEGYLEAMNETVPHISPEKLAEIARKY